MGCLSTQYLAEKSTELLERETKQHTRRQKVYVGFNFVIDISLNFTINRQKLSSTLQEYRGTSLVRADTDHTDTDHLQQIESAVGGE